MILLKMFSRQWWWTTLLVIIGTFVCVRLGIWQLDRLEQRRSFNAHVSAMRSLSTINLPAENVELVEMEYRRITASGRYDFNNQVGLRNRYWRGEYGYHLLTPLILDDGSAVIVDRGWIPAAGNSMPVDWRKYDDPGDIIVHGIVRLGRSKPDIGGVPDPELSPDQSQLVLWNLVNLERIGMQVDYTLLPIYIQLDVDPEKFDPPVPYQPEIELTEGPHLGYAFQWFTFASLLFVGYPFYLYRYRASEEVE